MERYLCIHGHFYQPPRENPWLEAIELQDSAYPHHDWNERINAECYAANAVSRILDGEGRISKITNNYAGISFNIGPTLLAWMADHAPDTYERILEADAISRERFSGHGSALAQTYNHMIMPLANRRDKVTQVRWGISDFRKRFGRAPEGMWLPETAVDTPTLEVLAEEGITFTILAPSQAARTRRIGEKQWQDVEHHHVDSTMPYVQNLPSGRSINLFFYDGHVSRAVAFERLLTSGATFAERLLGAFGENGERPPLVNIATDGESYGHHHRHGDMALAFALHQLDEDASVRLTNYGEFLEKHPPTHEVQIVENTAWSCVHGIGRWSRDCGCNTGANADWHQQWREPLREALDWLRDALEKPFAKAANGLLKDPWAARDAYIEVIVDRSPRQVEAFLTEHTTGERDEPARIRALKLMELQRNLMLMYTSCGWFFDELSGIETVQVIAYAGRAVQLAEDLFGGSYEAPFLDRLERAPSNIPQHVNGRRIFETMVKPAMLDLHKVGAHYAITSLFEEYGDEHRLFCYDVHRQDVKEQASGRSRLAVGRARIASIVTQESADLSYSVLHLGDHNLIGSVRSFRGEKEYAAMRAELAEHFNRGDVPETIRAMDQHFGDHRHSIASLFRDAQRATLDRILESTLTAVEQSYRHVYDDHVPLIRSLSAIGAPIPTVLRTTAEFIVNHELRHLLGEPEVDMDRVREMFKDAEAWGLHIDTAGAGFALQKALEQLADQVREEPGDLAALERLDQLAEFARTLPLEVDLWKVQNVYYALRETAAHQPAAVEPKPDGQIRKWNERFRALGEKLMVGAG